MLARLTRCVVSFCALGLLAACATQAAPESPSLPPIQRFTGTYFQNFEIQGFRADGSEEAWWVNASPESWEDLFASAPEGFRPPPTGFQIRAEVDARVTEPGRYGHLGSFPRGIYFARVINAELIPLACEPIEATIYFDSNEASVSEAAAARIDAVVSEARHSGCNVQRITVVGFTDSSGAAAYNQLLSERRAGAVRGSMVARGLAPALFEIEGRGENAPQRPTADGVNEPLNRGVHIRIESPHPLADAPATPAPAERPSPSGGAPAPEIMLASARQEPAFALDRRVFSPPSRWQPDQQSVAATAADRKWRRRRGLRLER